MSNKVKLAIFTAKNIRTSSGSTNTVNNILNGLNENKYEISIIVVDGIVPSHMLIALKELQERPSYLPFSVLQDNKKVTHIYSLEKLSIAELKKICEFGIIAIYNTYGEDGKLIGLLETAGIPYLSPSLKTSALCFDKQMTKEILRGNDIQVVQGFEMHQAEYNLSEINKRIKKYIGYPVIIKATSSGASWGFSYVENFSFLEKAINYAFQFSNEFIIEKFLSGTEFSVGIIGHYLQPTALPVVEIRSKNRFFDFEAKYVPGKSEEICPARISPKLTKEVQDIAIRAYKAVKGESHARIDIMYSHEKLYILEINTFPGLTHNSIFPKELKAAGMTLASFLDQRIKEGLKG